MTAARLLHVGDLIRLPWCRAVAYGLQRTPAGTTNVRFMECGPRRRMFALTRSTKGASVIGHDRDVAVMAWECLAHENEAFAKRARSPHTRAAWTRLAEDARRQAARLQAIAS